MPILSIHAERLFAEPCVNCGHPADAHCTEGCVYPTYDTETVGGRFNEREVVVEGSTRECGCTNFVGVGGI